MTGPQSIYGVSQCPKEVARRKRAWAKRLQTVRIREIVKELERKR